MNTSNLAAEQATQNQEAIDTLNAQAPVNTPPAVEQYAGPVETTPAIPEEAPAGGEDTAEA